MRTIRRAWNRLLKFIDWAPILWRDEDWDCAYILLILAHKLKRQRECILRNDIILGAQKVHDQIKVAEDALLRLAADDYHAEGWVEHQKKWPMKWALDKEKDTWFCSTMSDEESAEFKVLVAKEDELRRADEQLFVKTFLEGYRGWWD